MAVTINQAVSISKRESEINLARNADHPRTNTLRIAYSALPAVRSSICQYKPKHSKQAAGLALLIELGLIAIAVLIFNHSDSIQTALSEPVPITLLIEKSPPIPDEKQIPLPQIKTKPAFLEPKLLSIQQEPIVSLPPPPATPSQNTITEVPPLPPRASTSGDPNAEYAAKVHAAVQAATFYPPAAAALHFSGRVRVEFYLRDGIPSQARVLVSSGIGVIDRAALQSVQSAHYPLPPQEMRGNDRLYQVWVEFTR